MTEITKKKKKIDRGLKLTFNNIKNLNLKKKHPNIYYKHIDKHLNESKSQKRHHNIYYKNIGTVITLSILD